MGATAPAVPDTLMLHSTDAHADAGSGVIIHTYSKSKHTRTQTHFHTVLNGGFKTKFKQIRDRKSNCEVCVKRLQF